MFEPSLLCGVSDYPLVNPRSEFHSTLILREEGKQKNGDKFKLTIKTVNEHLKKMEYAVRGVVPMKANEMEAAIRKVRRICLYLWTHVQLLFSML